MTQPVEIPIRVVQLEAAVAEVQSLTRAATQGAGEVKAELSQVEKLMRKGLGANFLAKAIGDLGNAAGGAAAQITGVARNVIAGFGSAGPAGAAIGAGIALIQLWSERTKAAEEAARKLAEAQAAHASVMAGFNADLATQNRLRRIQIDLIREGISAEEMSGALAAAESQERVRVIQKEYDEARESHDRAAAAVSQYMRAQGVSTREEISKLTRFQRDTFEKLEQAELYLRREREALQSQLTEAQGKEEVRRGSEAIAETTRIVKADEDAAAERKRIAKELREAQARELEHLRDLSLKFEMEAEAERAKADEARRARREKRLRDAEDKELADRRKYLDAVEAAEVEAEKQRIAAVEKVAADQRKREADRDDARLRLIESEWKELDAIAAGPLRAAETALDDLTGAMAYAAAVSVESGGSVTDAIKRATAAQLKATAIQSTVRAAVEGAQALAALATGAVPAAKAHGLAAAKYAGAALAAGAGSAALGGGGGGGGPAGATATGPQAPATERREREERSIVINVGSGVMATRDELNRDLRRAIDTYDRRR